MIKAIAGFMVGLACLFIFSLTRGAQVFSSWEKRLAVEAGEKERTPGALPGLKERESLGKRTRLAMSPFDLANGLTFQDQEDLLSKPGCRLPAFLNLIGALWLVAALRKPEEN
jgi:hypothetical protein